MDRSTRIVTGVTTGSSGNSLLFGQDRRVSAADAAQINGTASHALDFDDCSNTLGGHPSAPILPVIFALADEYGASGRDFLTAYIVGFETECKLSMCVNFHQYTKGWHPTGTFGAVAAAAGVPTRTSGAPPPQAASSSVALASAASERRTARRAGRELLMR